MTILRALLAALLFSMAIQPASATIIVNGDFERGGLGWNSYNVKFTGDYYGMKPKHGSKMAVIGGYNPLEGGTLSQHVDLSNAGDYVKVSFAYKLAALDFFPLFEHYDKGDKFVAKIGDYVLEEKWLDDPNYFWTHRDDGPTVTDWVKLEKYVPVAQIGDPIALEFRTKNKDYLQKFAALVDWVSITPKNDVVPEPASLAAWAVFSIVGLGGYQWRRRRSKA